MMLNHSTVKSLKAGLLIMESSFYYYSCVLHIVFMLIEQNKTKQFTSWRKADPNILSFWSCKMSKEEKLRKTKEILCLSSSRALTGFPGWV